MRFSEASARNAIRCASVWKSPKIAQLPFFWGQQHIEKGKIRKPALYYADFFYFKNCPKVSSVLPLRHERRFMASLNLQIKILSSASAHGGKRKSGNR